MPNPCLTRIFAARVQASADANAVASKRVQELEAAAAANSQLSSTVKELQAALARQKEAPGMSCLDVRHDAAVYRDLTIFDSDTYAKLRELELELEHSKSKCRELEDLLAREKSIGAQLESEAN